VAQTSMFFTVNTPKHRFFNHCFDFLLIESPFSIGGYSSTKVDDEASPWIYLTCFHN
jgi:hypothetical protein